MKKGRRQLISPSVIVLGAIREQEIRRLLPQVSKHLLIAIHDPSSQFEVAAKRFCENEIRPYSSA
ncbi:MAG TPA: hypothetical protein VKE93_06255 [Candidatus Angelobacter sp.]|nr:hypothetical protein [Candidatus Angelobacter sp.]